MEVQKDYGQLSAFAACRVGQQILLSFGASALMDVVAIVL